jgi:hypothetical protein
VPEPSTGAAPAEPFGTLGPTAFWKVACTYFTLLVPYSKWLIPTLMSLVCTEQRPCSNAAVCSFPVVALWQPLWKQAAFAKHEP